MSSPEDLRPAVPAAASTAGTDPWRSAAPGWPALLAGCGQVLAVKDAASGRYRAIGPAWQVLFGLDPAACLGRTDVEIFGSAVASAWRAADQLALDRDGPVASDHAFQWRGQWRELAVTRQAVVLEGESGRQVLSHWSDVRAQRQQARQLAEALAALTQRVADVEARFADATEPAAEAPTAEMSETAALRREIAQLKATNEVTADLSERGISASTIGDWLALRVDDPARYRRVMTGIAKTAPRLKTAPAAVAPAASADMTDGSDLRTRALAIKARDNCTLEAAVVTARKELSR